MTVVHNHLCQFQKQNFPRDINFRATTPHTHPCTVVTNWNWWYDSMVRWYDSMVLFFMAFFSMVRFYTMVRFFDDGVNNKRLGLYTMLGGLWRCPYGIFVAGICHFTGWKSGWNGWKTGSAICTVTNIYATWSVISLIRKFCHIHFSKNLKIKARNLTVETSNFCILGPRWYHLRSKHIKWI